MKKTAQKTASTQKFIEIENIIDNIVFFTGGNAAMVVEVTATNFALLSQGEQQAKIASYVALLNSLSFPIQIFIRNKKLDISSYLRLLQDQEGSQPNPIVKERIRLYREFVANLVKVNTVLDKKFYIAFSFSSLEKGITAKASEFQSNAKAGLHTKAQGIQSQLTNLNLKNKVLGHDELASLFYEVYNGDLTHATQVGGENSFPIVRPTTL